MSEHSPKNIIPLPQILQREAAILCARAYREDASIANLLAALDEPSQLKLLEKYFLILIRFACKYATVLAVLEGEKLAGIKIFYAHRQYPPPPVAAWIVFAKIAFLFIPKVGFSKFVKYMKIISYLAKKHPQESHFYAELTCVDPIYQKRGIYTALKQQMIHLADEAGVGIYGETSNPTSARIIRRFGFNVIGEETIGGIRYWFLWREAIKKVKDEVAVRKTI